MKHRMISRKNIPPMLPIGPGVVLWLLMDRLQSPGWIKGVAWTIWGLIFAATCYALWDSEQVDVLKDKP
jgi:hypothetical protein